uniref:RNA-directed RNA polymerase L n=1 Tax=Macrotermes bellicosus bunya-like virus 1 TaxID=3133463 RepID=A0AAT9JF03_9VIRU
MAETDALAEDRYAARLTELKREFKAKGSELEEAMHMLEISGNSIFKIHDAVDKMRHDSFVLVVASRYDIDYAERSILDCIEPHLTRNKERAEANEDFKRTPDLCYKRVFSDDKGRQHLEITFFEVAVTNVYHDTMERKIAKYSNVIQMAKQMVAEDSTSIVNFKYVPLVVNTKLTNWDDQLNKLSKTARNVEFENECYEFCSKCQGRSMMLYGVSETLSVYQQGIYSRARGRYKLDETSDIFKKLDIDFVKLNKDIDQLKDSIKIFPDVPKMVENEDSILNNYLNMLEKHWRNIKTGFAKPTNKDVFSARNKVIANLKKKFRICSYDSRAPTFHFAYLPSDGKDQKGFQAKYEYAADIIKKVSSKETPGKNFIFSLFLLDLKKTDSAVFFKEGMVDDWDSVKKTLDVVREPKVFKKKVLKKNAIEILNSAHVGTKKDDLDYRSSNEREPMKTLAWWEIYNNALISTEIIEKYIWLTRRSLKKQTFLKCSENILEEQMNFWLNTRCHEYAEHIRRIAKNVIYRGSNASRGLNIFNTGNRNVWLVTLPGGDVTHEDGDIRFVQIIIVDKKAFEFDRTIVFNHDIVSEIFEADDKLVLLTRWMSINRNRWEHLERVQPIPFIALMHMRSQQPVEKMMPLVFTYMYCAFGSQSKISAIVDNFRYILPAALADFSGISQYIEDKMEIPTKTSGQSWMLKRLFALAALYTSEGAELKMEDMNFVDDELKEDSGGVQGNLTSAFIDNFKWNSRDFALGEIYVAFFLTGKAFHSVHQRDVDFVKTVVGGENEFNETFAYYKKYDVEIGLSLDRAIEVINGKRGGLFCTDAVRLSGLLATVKCRFEREKFNGLLEKEDLTGSVLKNPALCSTKSSLKDCKKIGNTFVVETQTMLETTLEEISSLNRSQVIEVQEVMNKHMNRLHEAIEVYKKTSSSFSSSDLKTSTSESDASNESMADHMINLRQRHITQMKNLLSEMEHQWLERRKRILKIEDDEIRSRLLGLVQDEGSSICFGQAMETPDLSVKLDINNTMVEIPLESYDDIMNQYHRLCLNDTLFRTAEAIDSSMMVHNSRYVKEGLRTDSCLFLALSNISTVPIYKIVAKGQRTHKDREIFVQNKSRYVLYVEEHLARCICMMNERESITVPGDEKMFKLKALFNRAQLWKGTDIKVNGCPMKKTVRYITGDMTKFSNHDTNWRLSELIKGMRENLPETVYKLMSTFIRLSTRKRVLAPSSLIKKHYSSFLKGEKDGLFEVFYETGGVFPLAKMKQNWLQGMRNYLSSAGHLGACLTMSKLFHKIDPKEFYFDFLVHSDDWVVAYGYSTPKQCPEMLNYDPIWRKRFGIQSNNEIDDFILKVIYGVYRCNNLTVSIKKSSVSSKFVEFVSYTVGGGCCYMGGEKQLCAVFSETQGKGPKEDTVSVLSQGSSAILKGIPSSVVDAFVEIALDDLRTDYSMNENQKFDPCKHFGVPRSLLPLCFIPKLNCNMLATTLSHISYHDVNLVHELLSMDINRENVVNAAKLVTVMSIMDLGKEGPFQMPSPYETKIDPVPGIKFRPKNTDKIFERIQLNSTFPKGHIKFAGIIDFTHDLMKPSDFMFGLLENHGKLMNEDVLVSLASFSRTTMLRARGDFKNKKTAKLISESNYDTLHNVFKKIKNWCHMTSIEDALSGLKRLERVLESNMTVESSIMNWARTIKYKPSEVLMNNKTSVIRIPYFAKVSETVNPVRHVIVKTLNPERFELNKIQIKHPKSFDNDVKKLTLLLSKSGYFDCQTEIERSKNCLMLAEFLPSSTKPTIIMTSPKRNTSNIENTLKWLFSRNLYHNCIAAIVQTGAPLHAETVVDPIRRNRLFCQKEITEIAFLTKFVILNRRYAPAIQLKYKEDSTIQDLLIQLKESCMGWSVNIGEKYKRMMSYLEFHYLRSSITAMELFSKTTSMTYLQEEQNWKRKDPYKDCIILLRKAQVSMKVVFEDGQMFIHFDLEKWKWHFPDLMNFFYLKHKNNFNIDNYRFFSNDMQLKHSLLRGRLFVVGSNGNYSVVKSTDEAFNTDHCIARLFDERQSTKGLDVTFEVKYSEQNELRIEIMGSIVGDIDVDLHDTSIDHFSIENVDDFLVDVNKLYKAGLLSDAITDNMILIRTQIEDYCSCKVQMKEMKRLCSLICQMKKLVHQTHEPIYEMEYNEQLLEKNKKHEAFKAEYKRMTPMFETSSESSGSDIDWSTSSSESYKRMSPSQRSTDSPSSSEETPDEKDEYKITKEYTEVFRYKSEYNSIDVLGQWLMQCYCGLRMGGMHYEDFLYVIETIFGYHMTEIELDVTDISEEKAKKLNCFFLFCKTFSRHSDYLVVNQNLRDKMMKCIFDFRSGHRPIPVYMKHMIRIGLSLFGNYMTGLD